ncbi:hypothetical protein [Streptosporangium sp. NPDC004631]
MDSPAGFTPGLASTPLSPPKPLPDLAEVEGDVGEVNRAHLRVVEGLTVIGETREPRVSNGHGLSGR